MRIPSGIARRRAIRWGWACALSLALLGSGAPAAAQPAPAAEPAASARGYATGDAWIDRQLADIDLYAQRYPASFLDEVGRYLSVRRGYAEAVLQAPRWRAGDLYFACAWAQAIQRPCGELVRAYSQAAGQDWDSVLAALPAPPQNGDYRQVRQRIVGSYDRWDRPIELDARLREQLGGRAQRLERARQAAEEAEAANAR